MNRARISAAIFVAVAASAFVVWVYWLGASNFAFGRWPASEFKTLKAAMLQPMHGVGIDYDIHSRLIAYPGKTAIACPVQTDRTAVLLLIGQSNAANSGGQRFHAQSGRVTSFLDGTCSMAASPLLGSAGVAGEPWSAIGDRLVAGGSFDRVVLIPAAIGGSGLSQWLAGGELHSMLEGVVKDAQRHYRITHVLWHQGETDFSFHTSEDAYVSGFQSLAADMRAWGVVAPIYVSVATRCDPIDERWSADNAISRAQQKLAASGPGFAAGVNTDALLDPLDRYDGCHIGGSGMAKVIDAWTEILRRK